MPQRDIEIGEAIEILLYHFDFERVYSAMYMLNMRWAGCDNETPHPQTMKREARRIMEECYYKNHDNMVGFGGFVARKQGIDLTFAFELGSYHVELDDD